LKRGDLPWEALQYIVSVSKVPKTRNRAADILFEKSPDNECKRAILLYLDESSRLFLPTVKENLGGGKDGYFVPALSSALLRVSSRDLQESIWNNIGSRMDESDLKKIIVR